MQPGTPETSVSPTFMVDFEPVGRRIRIPGQTSLLDAARSAGIGLTSLCGGEGWCEGCRVRLESGQLTPPTLDEQANFSAADLAVGYRLACQSIPLSDVKVYLPAESLTAAQRLQVEGNEIALTPDPLIEVVDIELTPPSLSDLNADADRLQADLAQRGFPAISFNLPVLRILSDQLRAQQWRARLALRNNELTAVLPVQAPVLGLAVDIGTTKLAAYLLDLVSGKTLAKHGAMNPQIAYGEDLVSRLAYIQEHPQGEQTLQQAVVGAINGLIVELCRQAAVSASQIVQAVLVGNTAMHHIVAGLPVRQLALAPYVPAIRAALEFTAQSIGLELAGGAMVSLLPNIAGYVGADHVAVILATDLWQTSRTVIAIDVGTNTEITLTHAGKMYSCSCASGPAFEGAHIQDGMRAAPGAIERVQVIQDEIFTYTIEDQPPVGICGSGILDAVAELRRAHILNRQGAIQEGHACVRRTDRGLEVVLAPAEKTGHGRDISISRKDINEIQLAKAAIRSGLDILFERAGIGAEQVEDFIIAGAFGSYLSPRSAVQIGMLPELPLERFRQVGNAAGMGAVQSLVSRARLKLTQDIAARCEYVELTVFPDFQKKFLAAMYL